MAKAEAEKVEKAPKADRTQEKLLKMAVQLAAITRTKPNEHLKAAQKSILSAAGEA